MSELVSTEWLAEHLKDVRVVDASWYMPDDKREPAKEFEQAHIPGAVFFDIDGIADRPAAHDADARRILQSGRRAGHRRWRDGGGL
jgi:3-mercaptopyruvate sulfurtransferase SseA